MWYELIPSMAIITTFMTLPTVGLWGLHKLFIGNAYARALEEYYDRRMYVRDDRLTGNPYKCIGLEGIPDEEPAKK